MTIYFWLRSYFTIRDFLYVCLSDWGKEETVRNYDDLVQFGERCSSTIITKKYPSLIYIYIFWANL